MITFASLARIQILLVPVGSIGKTSFDQWANEISSFEEIRLSDIPSDARDDRVRFMPSPLSTGSLLLNYTTHPTPVRRPSLSIFRPSDLILGVVGVATCSQADSLSNIYSQFSALLEELFPSERIFPFARNCMVFEEGDDNANLNVGKDMPGLVVIPSMMGNKKLYIGTLLSELCSNILGEFSVIVKALETAQGNDYLNVGIFGRFPEYGRSTRSADDQDRTGSPQNASANQSFADILGARLTEDTNYPLRRASTGPMPANNTSGLTVVGNSKKRQSTADSRTSHARLYKVLGDLFLLSGRTMDATIWYNEAIQSLKQPQDVAWQASAFEGFAVAEVIEAWSTGPGAQTGAVQSKETWAGISEKLNRAIGLYASAAESLEENLTLPALSYVYITACFRLSSLLYFTWLARGWSALAQEALLRGECDTDTPLEATAKRLSNDSHVTRLDTVAKVTRADVSGALTRAHGPWLLHLSPLERLKTLRYMTRMYSSMRYRRKEAYCLRELVASLVDLVIQGREELRERPESTTMSRETSELNASRSSIGIREKDEVAGNASVLSLVKYISQIHGVNLDAVKFQKDVPADVHLASAISVRSSEHLLPISTYSWPDLQVGIVREALAIAEALPDYSAVCVFALSALKCLSPYLDGEDQYHFHATWARAMTILRRRGDEREPEYWLSEIVKSVQFVPPNSAHIPHERLISELLEQGGSDSSTASKKDRWLYNPRSSSAGKRQVLAVVGEDIEFSVMIWNPYEIMLDIASLSISTSGVPFSCVSVSLTIPPNSSQAMILTGKASQPGDLIVRGCFVQVSGLAPHEALLPVYTEEEEEKRALRAIAESNEGERAKITSLDDRLDKNRRRRLVPSVEKGKLPAEPKFMELKIVPVQSSLRLRRTSLTNGAVMLYQGETSTIRFTVENVSALTNNILDLSFNDSTIAAMEQAINDGNLNAFEAYEAERGLVCTPVFSWDPESSSREIAPGQEQIISVGCFGKAGCTAGTIQVTYGHVPRTENPQERLSTYHVRQLFIPVIVTVYEILECSRLDIIPISATNCNHYMPFDPIIQSLENLEWCLLMLDVRNTYGIPFEVTLSYELNPSTKRIIPAGSTFRLLLPIQRFSLPRSVTKAPIPSPLNRQFVVTDLSPEENETQREIFWYREELLKKVHACWKEITGSRNGILSLRQEQLTLSMLRALRTESIRIRLTFSKVDNDGEELQSNSYATTDSVYRVPANCDVLITAHVQNLMESSVVVILSITGEPDDYIAFNGIWKDIPLGRLEKEEKREHRTMAIFLSQGYFTISSRVRVIDAGCESIVHGSDCNLVVS